MATYCLISLVVLSGAWAWQPVLRLEITTDCFNPPHGSAPDIMGRDAANPLACILSGSLLLGYLAEKSGQDQLNCAAEMIETAVYTGFSSGRLRPLEFGGNQGTRAVAREVINILPAVD